MKHVTMIAATLAACPVSATQAAPLFSPADHADAECALLMFAASQNAELPEADGQLTGTMAIYFIGKLIGRGVDYEAVMTQDVQQLDTVDLTAAGERCSAELVALGDEMQSFGTEIQQLEQDQR